MRRVLLLIPIGALVWAAFAWRNEPSSPADPSAATGAIRGRVTPAAGTTLTREANAASELHLAHDARRVPLTPDLRFEFADVAPGAHTVHLRVPGFEPEERALEVEAGRVTELELALRPASGGVLSGRVLDEHGQALAGVQVTVQSRNGTDPGPGDLGARTDAAGEFRIGGVPSGEVTIEAFHPDFRGTRLALGPLEAQAQRHGLALVLAAGRSLGGRVLDAEGRPAARASLWIESHSERAGGGEALRTDAHGRFLAEGLDAGPFRVTAWDELGPGGALTTAFRVAAGDLDLVLRLAAPAVLELALSDPARTPPRVALLDLDGFELEPNPNSVFFEVGRPLWSAHTRADGLELSGLAGGEYWVGLQDLERGRAGWTRATVRAGARARAEVVLVPATWLRLSVTEALVPLVVHGAGGFTKRLDSEPGAARGAHELGAFLPAGSYRLVAPDGRTLAETTLAGEPELRLAFE